MPLWNKNSRPANKGNCLPCAVFVNGLHSASYTEWVFTKTNELWWFWTSISTPRVDPAATTYKTRRASMQVYWHIALTMWIIITWNKNFSYDLIKRRRRLFSVEVCGTEVSLDANLISRHKCSSQPGELDPTLAFPYIARFQNEDDMQRSLKGNAFFFFLSCILYVYYTSHTWTVIKSNTCTRLRHYKFVLKHSVSNVNLQKLKNERENRNLQRKHANEIEVIKVVRSFLILAGFLCRL